MSDVAASLGAGKLVVLPPAFGGGDGIEVAVGLSRWWTRELKLTGREVQWFLLGVTGTSNPRQLQVLDAWPPGHVGDLLVASLKARFGLAPQFTPRQTQSSISVRLFEVADEGRVQAIDEWSLDADNVQVPAFVFEVAAGAARRLGTKLPHASWQDAFGTDDPVAAMFYLASLGGVALLEDGFAATAQPCLRALVEALKIDPTMQPAVDLMQDLLAGMVSGLGASELELAAAVRRTRDALGTAPGAWDGIVRRVMDDA